MKKNFRIFNSLKFKKAFTLAEVLITLGIIGVVAAITIPTLMSRYQKYQTVTRLKGIYSQIGQAIKMSEADHGEVAGWDLGAPDWFQRYLADYMKVTATKIKDLKEDDALIYKEVSGKRETGYAILNSAVYGGATSYTLLNGAYIMVSDTYRVQADYVAMIIDINGPYSLPNKFGKDTFIFAIYNKYGLVPSGRYSNAECRVPIEGNPGREFLKNGTCLRYGCNKNGRGAWCAALIVSDGWQIAKDYPW